ncbi:hypothetical protein WJX75_002098 [Coccomyxa subellipsoidea]|uniref:Transmembrane protein n=1 Tax=Coccomyxa subellipsoidea TaxID=248742 RepID=A0ABR2Z378_9CHLO
MSSGHAGERDVEAVGDQERHRAQREASASHNDVPIFAERSVRLRRAFLTLCTVDLVTVIAIGAFSMQQWRGPAWNSPIWPMLPLLLNRFIEIVALLLKNHFISITTSAVQVFLAVINLILCTQRANCATAPFSGCITVILAVCILILEIVIGVIVTLWVNWAQFMDWATASGAEMMLAAEGLSGREEQREAAMPNSAQEQWRQQMGAGKKFVGVVQPSENSFALAIVVDARCSVRAAQPSPVRVFSAQGQNYEPRQTETLASIERQT